VDEGAEEEAEEGEETSMNSQASVTTSMKQQRTKPILDDIARHLGQDYKLLHHNFSDFVQWLCREFGLEVPGCR
jgi:hypothetical protein